MPQPPKTNILVELLPRLLGPMVTGLAVSVSMWCAWVVLHHPAVGLRPRVSGPILIVIQVLALARYSSRWRSSVHPVATTLLGVVTGAFSGVFNLCALSSILVEQSSPAGGMNVTNQLLAGGDRPSLWIVIPGYLALSLAMGLVGGAIAHLVSSDRPTAPSTPSDWLGRLARITLAAVFPLLILGGLVTSTGSGLAVPDWPTTYGGNMFLYPISLMASDSHVYVEHSHRLFGVLVGFSTLILALMATRVDARPWVWKWAWACFALVCAQGVLGGLRVSMPTQTKALIHGVLAQLIFGMLAALAAYLSDAYRAPTPSFVPGDRARRTWATLTLHLLIIQLIMGAMYRHTGQVHALYTHIGLSLLVLAATVVAGAVASKRPSDGTPQTAIFGKAGLFVGFVVAIQFMLGGGAFFAVPPGSHKPVPSANELPSVAPVESWKPLVRTAHQGNGALLLAGVSFLAVHCRRLPRTKP
ncbi:MAG: COX15/CtaA family protein [Planctomycetota bacterium]